VIDGSSVSLEAARQGGVRR